MPEGRSTSQPAIAVDVQAVEKIYAPGTSHAVRALRRVSLDIRDNEFFTLLGPSGCGKGWLGVAPSLLIIGAFMLAPIGIVAVYSLLEADPYGGARSEFSLEAWGQLHFERDSLHSPGGRNPSGDH